MTAAAGDSESKTKARASSEPAGTSKATSAKKTASRSKASAKPAAKKSTKPAAKKAAKSTTKKATTTASTKSPATKATSKTKATKASSTTAAKKAVGKSTASDSTAKKAVAKKATAAKRKAPPRAAARTVAPRRRAGTGRGARATRKSAPLPGPEIKRAPKKAGAKTTTQEKITSAAKRPAHTGRRPLDGIRVLDLSRLLPGPYASHILASFGAEVIKVEKPGEGDYLRGYQPQTDGVSATFLTINRGKKSLAIDLKSADGKEAFLALIKKSDIVLDGFRPGTLDKLGIGYEEARKINPKIIYAALTGYGQSGPYSQMAGHDLNYIALAGMLDLLGDADGKPLIPGVQIADVAAGALPTVIGILLALQHRVKANEGQMVDVAMFDSLLGLLPVQIANYTATRRRPKRGQERLFGHYACYNIYPVRNGRFLTVAALEPKFWRNLCTVLEREDLIADQYVEGDEQEVLIAEMTRIFQKKEVSAWMELFEEQDVCVAEVREIPRVVQDDVVTERDMITPIRTVSGTVHEQLGVFPKLSKSPGYILGEPPKRGEHTRQLLKSVNFNMTRVNAMVEAGAAEEPPKE